MKKNSGQSLWRGFQAGMFAMDLHTNTFTQKDSGEMREFRIYGPADSTAWIP